jgi:hypothetical protein
LVGRNSFLVLNLALDVVDGIRGLDLKGDGLAGDCEEMLADVVDVEVVVASCLGAKIREVLTGLDEDLHICGCVCSRLMKLKDVSKWF